MRDKNNLSLLALLSRTAVMAFALLLLCPAVSRAAPLLRVSAAHPILPVDQNILQTIEITLSSEDPQTGEAYRLQVSSESGMGMLQLPGGFATRGEVSCGAGESVSITYRWAGPIPTESAVAEVITVSAPEIGLTGTAEFSIGVDMRITEIHIPEDAESGGRSEVSLIVEDILHPDADLETMLRNLGAAPEVKIALLRESSDAPVVPVEDAFAARFLGREAAPREAAALPAEYERGHLARTPDGLRYEWIGEDGRRAGIAPPAGGRYRVRASFRPGTGGIAVRETISPLFEAAGDRIADFSDIPGFMGSTVGIINAYTPEALPKLTQDIRAALQGGQNGEAASLLGAGLRRTQAASPTHLIGRYLETLVETQGNIEELSSYIQHFLRGYGGYGALLLSRSGVASWEAVLPDGAVLSQAPKTLGEAVPAGARLYAGDRCVVIPFELGKNFTLNITGSNKGGTSLWKIIPEGVNRKVYPQGDWEKEIAVYTGTLLPPVR